MGYKGPTSLCIPERPSTRGVRFCAILQLSDCIEKHRGLYVLSRPLIHVPIIQSVQAVPLRLLGDYAVPKLLGMDGAESINFDLRLQLVRMILFGSY